MTLSRRWLPYLFVAPFFLLFLVFGGFPLLFSLWLSFHQWEPSEGLGAMRWVGLENYAYGLTDPWLLDALYNTVWLALAGGLPQHLVALPLAYLIHRRVRRGRDLVLGAYFVPYISSSVAIAVIFATLYSRDYGLINAVLAELTRLPFIGAWLPAQPDWLGDAAYTKPAVAFVVFWRYLGWNLVLYLTAMQTLDNDLFEAATLDGASPWRQFFSLALPLLKPMIFFAITLSLIGSLQLFEEPFILVDSEKGVARSVMTAAIFTYQTAFVDGDYGTASAVAWALFALIALLTWLNARLFSRGSHA
jgi:multiple sugar transport system permease protein